MDFTAIQDFFSDETGSQYTAGMSYTAKDPARYIGPDGKPNKVAQKRANALIKLIPQWVKEGKVVLGRPTAAQIIGEG